MFVLRVAHVPLQAVQGSSTKISNLASDAEKSDCPLLPRKAAPLPHTSGLPPPPNTTVL